MEALLDPQGLRLSFNMTHELTFICYLLINLLTNINVYLQICAQGKLKVTSLPSKKLKFNHKYNT